MTEQEARNEMARMIRAGHVLIDEMHDGFLDMNWNGKVCGCALGAAAVADMDHEPDQDDVDDIDGMINMEYDRDYTLYMESEYPSAAHVIDSTPGLEIHGLPCTLAKLIDRMHCQYSIPRLSIATWLETGVLPERM